MAGSMQARSRRELHRKRSRLDSELVMLTTDRVLGAMPDGCESITDVARQVTSKLRTTIGQTKNVMMMYDFLPDFAWNMFFGQDKVELIDGNPVDPFFSSLDFLVETICYRLELAPDPEWRVCRDYLRMTRKKRASPGKMSAERMASDKIRMR